MKRHEYNFSAEVALRMEILMAEARSAMELRRIQAIYFRARYGEMAAAVSIRTGLKVQTIRNLHSAWLRKGEAVLETGNKGGRYREYLTLEEERSLIEAHRAKAEKGGILEVSLIHRAYEQAVGKQVAKSTVYRMLHRHGWRKIAPRPRHPKADKEAQAAFKKNWPELVAQAKEQSKAIGKRLRIFFQDEARFGRINEPQDCWAPKGVRPDVPAQIIREYTYVYGAVCPQDGASCYLILPAMDIVCMEVFLQELSQCFKDDFLLVACDGAACHTSGKLTLPDNIMLAKLPPQSPNLNPAENNWDDMREKFFHNLVFDSMNAVENQLVTACNFYNQNPQIVHSFSAWNWIVNT